MGLLTPKTLYVEILLDQALESLQLCIYYNELTTGVFATCIICLLRGNQIDHCGYWLSLQAQYITESKVRIIRL